MALTLIIKWGPLLISIMHSFGLGFDNDKLVFKQTNYFFKETRFLLYTYTVRGILDQYSKIVDKHRPNKVELILLLNSKPIYCSAFGESLFSF